MVEMDMFGQVAWIHLDRQMIVAIHEHLVTRIPRFSASHDSERTWSLHIRKAQSEDAGRYMCQVNSNPMITQVGIVDVVGNTFIWKWLGWKLSLVVLCNLS